MPRPGWSLRQIRALATSGLSGAEIARRLGCSDGLVYGVLRGEIARPGEDRYALSDARAAELYGLGCSVGQIADYAGRSTDAVEGALRRAGVALRPPTRARRIDHPAERRAWRALWQSAEDWGHDVDPRWVNFEAFLADLGPRPAGHRLARKDRARGYWPDNVRWAPR